jgi:GT2 family glycosyltransferase/ADP-heptose:LPS heptosyltransferase/Tfp pilus assembly protein PilF
VKKLNLGCGANRLNGWDNFDAELDISKPLPFEDSTYNFIFAEHVLEHIPIQKGFGFLKECFRIMRSGGVLRICVPSVEKIFRNYTDAYGAFLKTSGFGDGTCRGAIEAILFRHGHQSAWNEGLLLIILQTIGFGPEKSEPRKSRFPDLVDIDGHWKVIGEKNNAVETVVIDAVKPASDSCDTFTAAPKKKRRIAIGLTEHMGDIVACEPVSRYLRGLHPEDEITWVVKNCYRELLEFNPYIDHTQAVNCLSDWIEIVEGNSFDEYFDLHVNNRRCTSRGKILRKKQGNPAIDGERYFHYGSLLSAFCQGAGLPPLKEGPKVYIPEITVKRVNQYALPGRYIVIHCSSNETCKDWPSRKWIDFGKKIISLTNIGIVEVGTKSICRELLQTIGDKYLDLCGKLSILESAEIIRRASLFVGIDSGPAHIANATGTFGILLLGEYRIFKRYMPFSGDFADGRKAEVLYSPNGPAAIIPVESVLAAALKHLPKTDGEAPHFPCQSGKTVSEERRNKMIRKRNEETINNLPLKPRLIAFYLPQFHPIPENNQWWGKGFTEWTNVAKALPLFPGHYQPHKPGRLGFYDLRLLETRVAQAKMAETAGIHGFCYYHYWFNGKRLLDHPLSEVLRSRDPDFPFCICWANENWTRVWNGGSKDILIKQEYNERDDAEHIRYLCELFRDRRYIRIHGKPLFLVYRPRQFPNPLRTTLIWREAAKKNGIGELYLCQVESFPEEYNANPTDIGFDASVEFQPDWYRLGPKLIAPVYNGLTVFRYEQVVKNMLSKDQSPYKRFPCVTPSWDNSPRRKENGIIFVDSSPALYETWLRKTIDKIRGNPVEEQIVFINAWNEWGEGNHLEPDQKHGRGFLEATKKALQPEGNHKFTNWNHVYEIEGQCASQELLYRQAQDLIKSGKLEDAQKQLESLIEIAPDHSIALNDLGFLSYQRGEKEKAKFFYEKAVEKSPENITALKNLADFIFVEEKNASRAIGIYLRILKIYPKDLETLMSLANIAVSLGKPEDAMVFLNRLVALDPGNAPAQKMIEAILKIHPQNEKKPMEVPSNEEGNSPRPQIAAQPHSEKFPRTFPVEEGIGQGLTSIIILTYNQWEYTEKCLKSIESNTPECHEIILVDNGSTDGTLEHLRELAWNKSHYKLIANQDNCGFAKGCNQGIKEAKGAFVALLNNDVLVTKNWLSGLLECLSRSPEVGIVGPMTNNISGPQKVNDAEYKPIHELEDFATSFRGRHRHRRIPFRRIVGFCMLFRKDLVDQIGFLDESFGTGNFEDDDFCLRAEIAGFRNFIAGDVFIHHFGGRSFIGNRIDYGSTMNGNRKLFEEKWNGVNYESDVGKKLLSLRAREMAQSLYDRGEAAEAIQKYLAAVKFCPQDKNLFYELAGVFLAAKRYDKALEVLDELAGMKLDEKQFVLRAYCFEGLGKIKEADEWAMKALSMNPANALALNLKGILAFRKEEMDTAKDYFQRAIEADGGYGEPYTNLGTLLWSAGQKREALPSLEKGFILAPTDADIVMAYHTAITEFEEFSRGEKLFFEVKYFYPQHKRIYHLLVDLLLKQGKDEMAMQEIEEMIFAFGVEEGLLEAALEVRKKIGPREIKGNGKAKTISLCMIVKDEEGHLARCLHSVKTISDEMIIIDTGSADRTKNIAAAFGAKVFDFPWEEDFSAARNFSLSKAKGEWILVLDADEVISPKDSTSLLDLVRKERIKKTAYSFVTRNYTNKMDVVEWISNDGIYSEESGMGWFPSEKVRLFPNGRQVIFENPVHEFVEPSLKQKKVAIKKCLIPIHHYGKLDDCKQLQKGENYYLLGKKKLEKTADIQNIKELAIQAGNLKRYDEAIALWNRLLELQPQTGEAYISLADIYMKQKRYDKAAIWSRKALDMNPNSKEAALNYSVAEFCIGNVGKTISVLENPFSKTSEYPLALGLLSVAYVINGEKEKSRPIIEKIRRMGFNYEEYIYNTARDLSSLGREEQARSLLSIAAEENNNLTIKDPKPMNL